MDEFVQKQYAFRQFLLNYYDALAKRQKSNPRGVKLEPKLIQRYRNIVNQTDPEELFAPFSEKELDNYLSGKRSVSSKSPDRRVFDRVRVLLKGDLHHAIELDRNIDVIPDRWSNEQLYTFHQTLKQARMQTGSAPGSLAEFRKIDHDPQEADNTPENRARSAHPDGTKNTQFKYEELDPRKRAAEVIMYNEPSDYRVRQIEMDPERTSFKAFEEANRIAIEQGGQGFQRRQARKSPVTPFKTEPTFLANASERLKELTGIGLNGFKRDMIQSTAESMLGSQLSQPVREDVEILTGVGDPRLKVAAAVLTGGPVAAATPADVEASMAEADRMRTNPTPTEQRVEQTFETIETGLETAGNFFGGIINAARNSPTLGGYNLPR